MKGIMSSLNNLSSKMNSHIDSIMKPMPADLPKMARGNPSNFNFHLAVYDYYLSEDFIREFQKQLNWENICWKQKLSEDFILEFSNNVCWITVGHYQILSKEFIAKHLDKLKIRGLLWNKNIPEETKTYIRMFI